MRESYVEEILGRGHRMRRAVVCALCLLILVLPASPAAGSARHEIVVNIPAFSLHLYEDGVLTVTYPIGVGRVVNPSQLGPTRIINEVHYPTYYPPDWYARGLQPIPPGPDNPVGTRWLGLGFRGYGIHGTNEPHTIGTAASAGCVRMFNHDVEDLARRVGVGTSVVFTYQTIETWRDPVMGRPLIRVYADIYRQGTNTIAAALEALERIGAHDGVDRDALGALLGESAGEPRPIPRSVPLYVGDVRLETHAIEYGGRLLVPMEALARHTGTGVSPATVGGSRGVSVSGRRVQDVVWLGSKPYATVAVGAEAFGLWVSESTSGSVRLEYVSLVGADRSPLGVRALVDRDWLLLPVQELARAHGVQAEWDARLGAIRVDGHVVFGVEFWDGRAYLAHDRLGDLLGVEIAWAPGSREAFLRVPSVRFGAAVEERGFLHQGSVYVPLRPITDWLGFTLGWNQESQTAFVRGVPVRGLVRGGRVFAPVSALDGIVPSFEYHWDAENLLLDLRI